MSYFSESSIRIIVLIFNRLMSKNKTMKTLITLLVLGVSTTFSFATTYYSLQNGAWSDTGIWSMDGTTPCSCAPSNVLNGDTVIINHAIVQDAGMRVTTMSYINIAVNGALDGSDYFITVSNSEVLANGNVISKKLVINEDAIFTIQLAELDILTRLEIYGTMNINTANVNVTLGNVIVYPTGVFNMTGGSKLHYESGNFQNSGNTYLCDECCIQLDAGNIQNEVGGVVNGGGSMISDAGNVQNEGTWDTDIKWCSAGFDFGMPSAENCSGAYASCSGVPLPVELVVFEGTAAEGYNIIVWITASEHNCDYFVLERSDEGDVWTERAMVDGAGSTSLESYYSVRDNITEVKTYYYRLVQFDYNMDQTISNVISVHSVGVGPSELYPNPSQGEFFLLLDGHEPGMEITIYDINGNPVYSKEDIHDDKVAFQLQLTPGLYLVHIDRGNNIETLKLVIK